MQKGNFVWSQAHGKLVEVTNHEAIDVIREDLNAVISEFYPTTLKEWGDLILILTNTFSMHVCAYAKSIPIKNSLFAGGSNMATAFVTHDPTIGTYEFRLTAKKYDHIKNVVAFVKTFIPASDRSYDPGSNIWTIDEKHWPVVEPILKKHFFIEHSKKKEPETKYDYENFFYNHSVPAPTETRESISAKLETLLSVNVTTTPFEDLKRAYRRKALELHPDRNNGDGSKMSELNAAWTIFNKN